MTLKKLKEFTKEVRRDQAQGYLLACQNKTKVFVKHPQGFHVHAYVVEVVEYLNGFRVLFSPTGPPHA